MYGDDTKPGTPMDDDARDAGERSIVSEAESKDTQHGGGGLNGDVSARPLTKKELTARARGPCKDLCNGLTKQRCNKEPTSRCHECKHCVHQTEPAPVESDLNDATTEDGDTHDDDDDLIHHSEDQDTTNREADEPEVHHAEVTSDPSYPDEESDDHGDQGLHLDQGDILEVTSGRSRLEEL